MNCPVGHGRLTFADGGFGSAFTLEGVAPSNNPPKPRAASRRSQPLPSTVFANVDRYSAPPPCRAGLSAARTESNCPHRSSHARLSLFGRLAVQRCTRSRPELRDLSPRHDIVPMVASRATLRSMISCSTRSALPLEGERVTIITVVQMNEERIH